MSKGILQIYVGLDFDQTQAKELAQATGYEKGRGKKLTDHPGNMSGLVSDILSLPPAAGPELALLIKKWRRK